MGLQSAWRPSLVAYIEELLSSLAGGWEEKIGLNEHTVVGQWREERGQHVKLEFE